MALNRVGILTGEGDCSGLNAVIRAITRTAIIQHSSTVIGIEDGFDGFIFGRYQNHHPECAESIGISLGRSIK
jgi:ATP-dependent phosphofructokinase / diphosphate-dependent phosphofructokinase